jgi:hypothetical protein
VLVGELGEEADELLGRVLRPGQGDHHRVRSAVVVLRRQV